MNIFRLIGDMSHVAAIVILLLKIWKTRSVAGKLGVFASLHSTHDQSLPGISGKSQILFASVFLTRYLDLLAALFYYFDLSHGFVSWFVSFGISFGHSSSALTAGTTPS